MALNAVRRGILRRGTQPRDADAEYTWFYRAEYASVARTVYFVCTIASVPKT
jgi:hypothetical protein